MLLTVYTEQDDNLTEKHSKYFLGLTDVSSLQHTKTHIIINSPLGMMAHNFVTGEDFFVPFSENLDNVSWFIDSEKRNEIFVSVSSTLTDEREHRFVDLNTHTYKVIDDIGWYLDIGDNFIRERIRGEDKEDHFVINKSDNSRKVMYSGETLYAGDSDFGEHGFIYAPKSSESIVVVDPETLLKDTILVIPEGSGSVSVSVADSIFVVFVEVDFGKSEVYIFDRERKLINNFESNVAPYSVNHTVIGNKIFGRDPFFFTIDIVTGITENYDFSSDFYLLKDEGILLADFGDKLKMLNLNTGQVQTKPANGLTGNVWGITILEKGNGEFYINLDSRSENSKSLFYYNGTFLLPSNILPFSNVGIINGGVQLANHGDKIILLEEDLHLIEGTDLEKINDKSILKSYYGYSTLRHYESKICWLQNDSGSASLYCMENEVVNNYGKLPNSTLANDGSSVYDYHIVDQSIFYVNFEPGLERYLYQYDFGQNKFDTIAQRPDFESRSVQWRGETIFYQNNDTIYSITGTEKTAYYIPNIYLPSYDIITFKGENYLDFDNKLYRFGESVEVIYQGTIRYLEVIGDYLYFISGDQEFTTYDGQELRSVELGSEYVVVTSFGENMISIIDYFDDFAVDIYNFDTKETIPLDERFRGRRIVDTFSIDNLNFLITSINLNFTTKVEIYSFDGNFENFELVKSFFHSGGTQFDIKRLSNNSLLYVGPKMFKITSDYQFIEIEGVKGFFSNNTLVKDEEYIYFFALDDLIGRQVFRIHIPTFLESEDLIEMELVIYPNPASDYLRITDENLIHSFKIFNLQGKLIKSSNKVSSEIFIGHLELGAYLVDLKTDNGHRTLKFIKM